METKAPEITGDGGPFRAEQCWNYHVSLLSSPLESFPASIYIFTRKVVLFDQVGE